MPNKFHIEPPNWLAVAVKEIDVQSFQDGSSNPRITAYHEGTSIEGFDDKVSWCSSFVHWALAQVGIPGTKSALARSWLEWGRALANPKYGCIAILWREEPASWKGHVGFYLGEDDEFVYLLGGNQLDAVREHFYPKATVLGYRWPNGIPETYLG